MSAKNAQPAATRPERKRRSDGERSRQAILQEAARLATLEGIGGLSIARLADAVGMSKSGLFAHFGSKQELQLATIAAAAERFSTAVIEPSLSSADGAPRLRAMGSHYLEHLDIYAGGCFWGATSAEYDDRPGPVRDAIAAMLDAWMAELVRQARIAGIDQPERYAFELYAVIMGANSRYRISGDAKVFEYARGALKRLEAELPE
jgi:AcrR family transcriptional regulator